MRARSYKLEPMHWHSAMSDFVGSRQGQSREQLLPRKTRVSHISTLSQSLPELDRTQP